MKKHKIVVTMLLIALFISFGFPTKTFADSNQSGSSVGIYFENDYIPSNNNSEQPTKPTNNGKTTYPNMGEMVTKSIPYIGIILIVVVIYLYFRSKKKHKRQ